MLMNITKEEPSITLLPPDKLYGMGKKYIPKPADRIRIIQRSNYII